MLPEELKRQMRFSHPEDNVSMRNRNYRWTQPTYEIKNIRRDAEDPNNTTVYYEDVKGNKYKTNAQMFVERFGDFYIESGLKQGIKLLAQVPGYDSPTPAVENTNPASIPRSCPNCGYMAMGSDLNAAIEQGETDLKCPRCGFSINNAPDEKFLMAREKMSKLNSAVKKFGQWKEHITELSDELYFPSKVEGENPTMRRIRELEEELGLPPLDLAEMPGMEEDYLAFLEDEAVTWKGEAKKAQTRERYPEEYDLELPEYSDDGDMHRYDLVEMLQQYHAGMSDPIYAFTSRPTNDMSLGELQAIETILENIIEGKYMEHVPRQETEDAEWEEQYGKEYDSLFEDQQTAEAWLPTIKRLLEELPEERWEKSYVGEPYVGKKKEAVEYWDKERYERADEEWEEYDIAREKEFERSKLSPTVKYIRELEEEMKIEPMDMNELRKLGDTPEDYLEYLEEQFRGPSAPPETYSARKKEAAYGLSFSPEFYGNPDSPKVTERPTNVTDALASMSDEEWNTMAQDVFNVEGDVLGIDSVITKIMETDTCGDLTPPVDVWIDEEGYYTVDVYDEESEDIERDGTWFSLVNEGR